MAENEITERRNLDLGETKWTVDEFDDGRWYIMTATSPRAQFLAHFSAGEWAQFQTLIAGQS
jgi:hypothetical protein